VPSPSSEPAAAAPLVALLGNPNTGKTTLFNRLTGQQARVGNYPGVTVERTTGRLALSDTLTAELLDVPGAYSLAARSPEEQITLRTLLGWDSPAPDLVVVVANATQLSRSLYLAVQLLELRFRCIVALNMIDELAEPPNTDALSAWLGAPVIPISAQQKTNLDGLTQVIRFALQGPPPPAPEVPYPVALSEDVDAVVAAMPPAWAEVPLRSRALALWALSSIGEEDELADIPPPLRAAVLAAHARGRDIDLEIISARYTFIDDHLPTQDAAADRPLADRIDRVLLHPVWGFGVFVAIMLVMFQSLFAWADPFIGLIESLVGLTGELAAGVLPPGILADLITEGIIGGVGNVIVFLPQILLLFLFIGLMEDAGYMARVAYLMDRIMRALGLQGQAFVPMLSGFACAVPAVMATRTMPSRRDRLLTMMVVPLMTCSARLPVYTLLIAALYPPSEAWGNVPVQGLMMIGLYLFSIGVSLFAAWAMSKTVLRGPAVPFLMELPPFRVPLPGNVARMMWQRARLFLSEAGGVILVCTVLLWGLLSFPQQTPLPDDAPPAAVSAWEAEQLSSSYAGQFGHAIEPVIAPLGFDWKIGVGLVGSFAAREVFVSTMGLVYGIGGEVDEESPSLRDAMRAETRSDGKPVYTPLVGMSLMIFFALACQCMSTLAVVKRETGGYAWPAFLFVYMTALAWLCSFVVYQGGRLLGLG